MSIKDVRIKHVAESGKQLKKILERLENIELKRNFKKVVDRVKERCYTE